MSKNTLTNREILTAEFNNQLMKLCALPENKDNRKLLGFIEDVKRLIPYGGGISRSLIEEEANWWGADEGVVKEVVNAFSVAVSEIDNRIAKQPIEQPVAEPSELQVA